MADPDARGTTPTSPAEWEVPGEEGEVSYFYLPQRYSLQGGVGAGTYGAVACAVDQHKNEGGDDDDDDAGRVAIKKVDRCYQSLHRAKKLVREVRLLKHFAGHPNIVKLVELVWPTEADIHHGTLYIVTELLQTDLRKVFRLTRGERLTERQCRDMARQVLRGVDALHRAQVIHRDIKPANIFVSKHSEYKIGDFGLARDGSHRVKTCQGVMTELYRPPELSQLFRDTRHVYDYGVDIWSVGCVVAEMLSVDKRQLFSYDSSAPALGPLQQVVRVMQLAGAPDPADMAHLQPAEARERIQWEVSRHGITAGIKDLRAVTIPGGEVPRDGGGAYWPATRSDAALDFIKQMLAFSSARRPAAGELLDHPFLTADTDDEDDDPNEHEHAEAPPPGDNDHAEEDDRSSLATADTSSPPPPPPPFDGSFEDHMTSIDAVRKIMNVMIAQYHPTYADQPSVELHPTVTAQTAAPHDGGAAAAQDVEAHAYYCVDDQRDHREAEPTMDAGDDCCAGSLEHDDDDSSYTSGGSL